MQERCASRSPLLMKTNPAVIRTVAAPFSAASMEGRSWTVMGDSRAPCRTQAGRAAAEGRPGRIERACARPRLGTRAGETPPPATGSRRRSQAPPPRRAGTRARETPRPPPQEAGADRKRRRPVPGAREPQEYREQAHGDEGSRRRERPPRDPDRKTVVQGKR